MTTDASKLSGTVMQHYPDVDSWLAAVVTAGRRWEGCIMYNDDPPEAFPDGSPTGGAGQAGRRGRVVREGQPWAAAAHAVSAGASATHVCHTSALLKTPAAAGYVRPAPYRLCGHCKGVVVWDRRCVGWLVHSLPCWPCHDRSAPSGCAALSSVQPQQTDRGQSFLWVQLPVQALSEVLMQVLHMQVGGWAGRWAPGLRDVVFGSNVVQQQGARSVPRPRLPGCLLNLTPACLPASIPPLPPAQAFVYYRSDPRVWPHAPRDYTKATGRGFRLATLG